MSSHRALIVTAADYNGKSFDGNPVRTLSPLKEGETTNGVAPWFYEAVKDGKILVEARGCTDYAWFGVKDEYHNVHWAGPGDMIVNNMGHLMVVPAPIVKYLERIDRDMNETNAITRQVKTVANAMQLHGMMRALD